MHKQITSLQNPFIKNVALLAVKSRERQAQGLLVAEGLREVGLALKNSYEAAALLYDGSITPAETVDALAATAQIPPLEIIEVTSPVFEKIAYRTSVPNVVAVLKTKHSTLSLLTPHPSPLILVLESIEKPGNLGAVLRTADAAGVDAVLVCDPLSDIFHPNVIRASLGAIFTMPVIATSSEEATSWLKVQGISIIATYLEAAKPLYDCDLAKPSAIIFGAEATGISEFWIKQADERIIIPMSGQVDSLNVSASAAVVLFEAVRQRRVRP